MKVAKKKTAKQMERHLKGVANHHRIDILMLVATRGDMTLEDIVEALEGNEKTIGEHARRLHRAGLIDKNYNGRFVVHRLSPYGEFVARFLQTFRAL